MLANNNKAIKFGDKFKKYSILLFNLAIFSAMVQGAAVTVFAIVEKRPPAPHRYFDSVSGLDFYYFFSIFKHLFYVASIAMALFYLSQNFLKQDKEERVIYIKYLKNIFFSLGMLYIPMLIVASQSSGGWLIFFAGLKSIMPFTAVIVGFIYNKRDLRNLSAFIDVLLLAHLAFAVLQKISGFINCGADSFSCDQIRMTGMFLEPNTMGGVVLIKVLLSFVTETKLSNQSLLVMCGILFLSQSKTNLVIFVICFLLFKFKSSRLLSICILFLTLTFSYLISSRGFQSLHERFVFLTDVFNGNIWFGNGFGQGTQAHSLLKNFNYNVPELPFLDSQVASILYQGGIWYLFTLLILSLWLLTNIKSKSIKVLLIIFWLSAGTLMVMEVWPLNIIIFMTIGYLLKNYLNFNNCNSNCELEMANRN